MIALGLDFVEECPAIFVIVRSDCLKSVADCRNRQYRLICGIENQQATDNTMPVRSMGYDYASYEEQIRQLQAQNRADNNPAYFGREGRRDYYVYHCRRTGT